MYKNTNNSHSVKPFYLIIHQVFHIHQKIESYCLVIFDVCQKGAVLFFDFLAEVCNRVFIFFFFLYT